MTTQKGEIEMSKSCLTCVHKEVCLKRGMFLFQFYVATGRYGEIEEAKEQLDISVDCKDWKGKDE